MNRNYQFERQGSQEKGIVVVSPDLLARIDLHRDTLSRADFVELCIDSLTGTVEDRADGTEPSGEHKVAERHRREDNGVSRAEFEEFKSNVLDLLRTCFEAFCDSLQEPLDKATSEAQEL